MYSFPAFRSFSPSEHRRALNYVYALTLRGTTSAIVHKFTRQVCLLRVSGAYVIPMREKRDFIVEVVG